MKVILIIYIAGVIHNLCYLIFVFSSRDFNTIAEKNKLFSQKDKIALLISCFLSWFVLLIKHKSK